MRKLVMCFVLVVSTGLSVASIAQTVHLINTTTKDLRIGWATEQLSRSSVGEYSGYPIIKSGGNYADATFDAKNNHLVVYSAESTDKQWRSDYGFLGSSTRCAIHFNPNQQYHNIIFSHPASSLPDIICTIN